MTKSGNVCLVWIRHKTNDLVRSMSSMFVITLLSEYNYTCPCAENIRTASKWWEILRGFVASSESRRLGTNSRRPTPTGKKSTGLVLLAAEHSDFTPNLHILHRE